MSRHKHHMAFNVSKNQFHRSYPSPHQYPDTMTASEHVHQSNYPQIDVHLLSAAASFAGIACLVTAARRFAFDGAGTYLGGTQLEFQPMAYVWHRRPRLPTYGHWGTGVKVVSCSGCSTYSWLGACVCVAFSPDLSGQITQGGTLEKVDSINLYFFASYLSSHRLTAGRNVFFIPSLCLSQSSTSY